jgi:dipeptidyl aminopeptidase/acylaminoacyl peptidase
MYRDIRETALYKEAESLYKLMLHPGSGRISDASEIHASADGAYAVFSGTLPETLEGSAHARVCHTVLASGDTRVLTFGPNTDRSPRFSPDGRWIAFLSDRRRRGDFQLYLLDRVNGAARAAPAVDGWVEYLQWSPDGSRILLGVAGHGADVAGGQGAVKTAQSDGHLPPWIPIVHSGCEAFEWRSSWVYEVMSDALRRVSAPGTNVWEATWCGNDAVAAVISRAPREGSWYTARGNLLDIRTGACIELYSPRDQTGCLSASPSGATIAFVDAVCSDRGYVAGSLHLVETKSGRSQYVDTRGVDVAYTEWRSEQHLLLAGHRAFETVVALYDAKARSVEEVWSDTQLTTGGRYVSVAGFAEPGDCVLIGEGFTRAPEIAAIRRGRYEVITTLHSEYSDQMRDVSIESVRWSAPDDLEIHGWLLRTERNTPAPLVMSVHGGPVWHSRPRWLGRTGAYVLMLLERGYVMFFPNPRGSSGRGQDFARRVIGDVGGADMNDLLSGLDYLVMRGIAERDQIGVTGISYGGFMTCWLITQDPRFAAAVPVAPVTNHVSQHLISNIPEFDSLFLADRFSDAGGRYFQRSPVMHAQKVRTPTLSICGALDRCTPAEQAIQFHNALKENGADSELVIYPCEGHGVRNFPACIDYAARLVGWFEAHMAGRARDARIHTP